MNNCEKCGSPLVKRREGIFIYATCPKCNLKEKR